MPTYDLFVAALRDLWINTHGRRASREELAVQMGKGKVGGRWCSCDEDIEGTKLDGRERVDGLRMVDGGEN